MQLHMKLFNLNATCNTKITARVFMHICGVNKTCENKVGPLEESAGNIISQGFFNGGIPK